MAVKRSGGCKCMQLIRPIMSADSVTVQGALEWLEANQDKSMDEIKLAGADEDDSTAEAPALKPGEEARSLVCNECGKKFRSQAQAEFHASKTYVMLLIRHLHILVWTLSYL